MSIFVLLMLEPRFLEHHNYVVVIGEVVVLDNIGQCIVKIRKDDKNNTLAFKISPSSLPKLLSNWFTCGCSLFKSKKPKQRDNIKADANIVINSKGNGICSIEEI